MTTRLLVTGFGPFPRMPRNPTSRLAVAVARSPRWKHLRIRASALVLPTTYAAIETILLPRLWEERPDAVLMPGVAGRAAVSGRLPAFRAGVGLYHRRILIRRPACSL